MSDDQIILEYESTKRMAENRLSANTWRLHGHQSLFCALFGVIVPFLCFLFSCEQYPLGPDWQNGKWTAYVGLIPTAGCAWPFYPLLAYSMISAMVMVLDPVAAAAKPSIRLGLGTGIVLSGQFLLIQGICSASNQGDIVGCVVALLFVAAAVGLVGWLYSFALQKTDAYLERQADSPWPPFFKVILILAGPIGFTGLALVSILIAPSLSLLSYIVLSAHAANLRPDEDRKGAWKPLAQWIFGYAVAWNLTLLMVVRSYSKLPAQAPSQCFIASAAVNGHPTFVGSRIYFATNGCAFLVNNQLCRLKLGELAIRTFFPRFHGMLRRIYNRVGPPTAAMLGWRYAADLAYVSLKPAEWLTVLTMRLLFKDAAIMEKSLYPKTSLAPARHLAIVSRSET